MAFNDVVVAAKTYFPNLQVKYKDQSPLMQFLGKLLFFNPNFMKSYLTTLGNTVYLPSQQWEQDNSQSATCVFIHECTHMYDEKRLGFLYQLAYAFPQLLSIVCFLAMFLVTWKIMLPLGLLMLAPLPAPWRAYFEKRAYFVQMYVVSQLWNQDPEVSGALYASWFRDGSYYWMWLFEKDAEFAQEAINIKAGNPSCSSEPALLKQVNDLITAAKI